MKKIKTTWWTYSNRILSALLTLLGFTSCSLFEGADEYGPMVLEYGCPYATYEAQGTVTDEEGTPIEGEQVIVRQSFDGTTEHAYSDTVLTDEHGRYTYTGPYHMLYENKKDVRIVAKDPNRVYADDSVTVTPRKTTEGEGAWYQGTYSNLQDFKLKKNTNPNEQHE